MPNNPDYTDSGGGGGGGGNNRATDDQVRGWYQQYLGRGASDAEARQWGSGGMYNASAAENYIKSSDEAKAYAARMAAQAPQGPPSDPSGNGGSGGGGGGGYGNDAYNNLNNAANARAAALGQPQSFPLLDQYMQMLTQQEQQAKQRAQDFAGQLNTRIGQLQQPLLTQQDNANIQAQALNNVNTQRDKAMQDMMTQVSNSGFAPTSGLIQGNQRAIQEQYGNQASNIQAQLANASIQQNEQRKNEATQLQGLVAQALSGGDLASLQAAAQNADMENQQYNINQQRAREQLSTLQIPVDLSNMGLMNSMGALGATSGSPLSSLFPLLGYGQAGQNNSQQGWGWLMSMMGNMFH